jgi:hypothetical protein
LYVFAFLRSGQEALTAHRQLRLNLKIHYPESGTKLRTAKPKCLFRGLLLMEYHESRSAPSLDLVNRLVWG